MKLAIENGTMYVNSIRMCFAGASNGRTNLPAGSYEVAALFSHAHGCDLPNAQGLGWIGPANFPDAPECDIVLGRVRDGNGQVLHQPTYVSKLITLLEVAEDRGERATLVIESC